MSAPTHNLEIHAKAGRAHVDFLRRQLSRALPLVPRAPREVSVALVGDAQMAELHVRFLKIAGPTDVLTFELAHDARGRVTAGEIVACVPEARRQAKRNGVAVEHELLLYLIHGLLHLTGHDDHDPAAYRRMHSAEDRLLSKLGVGPVFNPRAAAPRDRVAPPPRRRASGARPRRASEKEVRS